MTARFDAYQEWLDLETEQRPPTYYQLLRLPEFSDDPQAVNAAAARCQSRVRSRRPGPHAAEWARLLDEIAEAKACLTDPDKKASYDRELRNRRSGGVRGPVSSSSAAVSSAAAASPEKPALAKTANVPYLQPRSAGVDAEDPMRPLTPNPPAEAADDSLDALPDPMAPLTAFPSASSPAASPSPPLNAVPDQWNVPPDNPMAPLTDSPVETGGVPPGTTPSPPGVTAGPAETESERPIFRNPAGSRSGESQLSPMQPLAAQPVSAQPGAGQQAPGHSVSGQSLPGQPFPFQPASEKPESDPSLPGPVAIAAAPAASHPLAAQAAPAPLAHPLPSAPSQLQEDPPELKKKLSPTQMATQRAGGGIVTPILAGVAVGLFLLVTVGLYYYMSQNEGDLGPSRQDLAGRFDRAPAAVANEVVDTVPAPGRDQRPDPPTVTNEGPGKSGDSPPEVDSSGGWDSVDSLFEPGDGMEPDLPATTAPDLPDEDSTPDAAPAPAPAPVPENTPETAPETAPEPAGPSPEDLRKLSSELEAARERLLAHDFSEAERHLAAAAPLVKLEAHQTLLQRLQTVAGLAGQFQAAIVEGTSQLGAGEFLSFGDSSIGIVEASPEFIVVRVRGMNQRFPLTDLPLGLAVALAHQAIAGEDPNTIAMKACFVATSPKADDAALQKARGWFAESAGVFQGVENPAGLRDDNYDFGGDDVMANAAAGDTSEPTPIPTLQTTPDLPTRAELTELAAALKRARSAIISREFAHAKELLSKARPLAKLPAHAQKLARLEMFSAHLQAFDQALADARKQIEPGDALQVGTSTKVKVVRVTDEALVVEVAGQSRSYPLRDLPLGLAAALAGKELPADAPSTAAMQAAYAVANPDPSSVAISMARRWYQEAAAGDASLSGLEAVIDDNYDLSTNEVP